MQRFPAVLFPLLFLLSLCLPSALQAHEVAYVRVAASFDTKAKSFSVEMVMEVDPSSDEQLNIEITPEDAASTFATDVLGLYFGDTKLSVEPVVEMIEPEPDDIDLNFPERRKVIVTLAGDIPADSDYFTLHLSAENQATVIMIRFVDGKAGRRAEVLFPGEFSTPVDLQPITEGDAFDAAEANAAAQPPTNSETTPDTSAEAPKPEPTVPATETTTDARAETSPPTGSTKTHSFTDGFLTVLPQNFLLIAVLLALFFFHKSLRLLVYQAGLFLFAFDIVFALGTLADLTAKFSLPVFLITALLIAALAVENLFNDRLRWWRCVLIIFAGISTGWWLAGEFLPPAPSDAGLTLAASAGWHMLGAVAAFALGLAILHFTAAPIMERKNYRKYVAFPASLLALAIALFYAINGASV